MLEVVAVMLLSKVPTLQAGVLPRAYSQQIQQPITTLPHTQPRNTHSPSLLDAITQEWPGCQQSRPSASPDHLLVFLDWLTRRQCTSAVTGDLTCLADHFCSLAQ